ncbi:regulatory protein FAM213A [Seminavis robusta]|uniref:Regulatory protein FAM213A n=1 Tax=Seminavis robusta TaxID=568900 RepID=A0A9N8E7X5_9STRA|nr:regulatory protein FAM213A [Seminavis robusta]|eukprot:Sro608_g174740.1 regulatory protein FAM213A (231) ;mRNA; r:2756-3448
MSITPTQVNLQDSSSYSTASSVPDDVYKRLPKMYKSTKLAPVDLKFDMVREESHTVSLKKAHKAALRSQVLSGSRKAQASVMFVVKRPGCILCHEQGDDLQKLVGEFSNQSVAAFACIKEINVDDEGLLTLYKNYFQFPFYRDTELSVYSALGDRKVNVVTALRRWYSAKKRWEKKGLRGNMIGKGEGMLLGGVMVFNRKGELQYAYKEQIGLPLPIDEIRTAIKEVMNE